MLQAGYSATSPRALVEMVCAKYIVYTDENDEVVDVSTLSKENQFIRKEALKEGFLETDEYLGFIVGEVLHTENC